MGQKKVARKIDYGIMKNEDGVYENRDRAFFWLERKFRDYRNRNIFKYFVFVLYYLLQEMRQVKSSKQMS